MTALRVPLTETEIRKYRWLGRKCAEAVESVCRQIEPGMTDLGIEALLCDALRRQAILPAGTNVRTDGVVEEVNQKPRRDVKRVEKYAELEVAARAWGLTVAVARHIHFGPVPEELQKKANAAARINAGCWARTEPGVAAGSILVGAISDYADTGFLDGWRQRDLGGAIGYRTRDWLASPGSARILQSSAAYVWNPAVDGFTMEDTVLLIDDRLEILTETSGWPIIESKALGTIYRAPGILVR